MDNKCVQRNEELNITGLIGWAGPDFKRIYQRKRQRAHHHDVGPSAGLGARPVGLGDNGFETILNPGLNTSSEAGFAVASRLNHRSVSKRQGCIDHDLRHRQVMRDISVS